jgi:uncharacterized protein (DUF1501 family)
MLTRREFLSGGAGLGFVSLGARAPALWQRAARAAEPKPGLPILVVIELSGGNDGLNTVVPIDDDLYAKARPTLRIEPKSVLKLDDRVGLNPAMKDLHKVWDAGDLAVVQGAGYPNPNRSHFRSMEIWQTGEVGPVPDAGWLGRAAELYPSLGPCYVGGEATPMAVRGRKIFTPSIASLADFRIPAGMSQPADRASSPADELAREVRRLNDLALGQARRLEAVAQGLHPADANSLTGRLTTIRVLLENDPGLRVFYTTTGAAGFDTHAAQVYTHRELLRTLSSSVANFLAELRDRGLAERVVVLMFSEFGRRLRENAQGGTDHGAAGPVFLAGAPVRGGLIGSAPDLANLDQGDLKFTVDFRDVYATLLSRWLNVDPVPILGRRDEAMPLL